MTSSVLFEERERDDPGVKRAAETTHEFISRVDDCAFARVRKVFNAWFARYASEQDTGAARDLGARFRAKQDGQFYGAFWELYLYEVHRRLGFDIELHPESNRGTRPDFRLTRGERSFYLEAVMPSASAGQPNEPGSVQTVIEHVDAALHPDFFLKLRFVIPGHTTPSKREVLREVQTWLGTLTWDDLWQGGIRADVAYPEAEVRVRDWLIGLQAFPRSPERRQGDPSPMIGIYRGSGGFMEAVAREVAPKLDEKANKYGDLDAPYEIAAWFMSPLASHDTAAEALFDIELPHELGRHATGLPSPAKRDALWTPNRTRRGRASAVLAVPSFTFNYSGVSRTMPHLWLNPWADYPLDVELPFATSRMSPDERFIENAPAAMSASELVGLAADWPGQPFQDR